MKIDINKIAKSSKVQAKIFSIFKKMQQSPDDYLVILDKNNQPMSAIVSPNILKKYLDEKEIQDTYNSDDIKDFYKLSTESMKEVWDNNEDDIYQNFYK